MLSAAAATFTAPTLIDPSAPAFESSNEELVSAWQREQSSALEAGDTVLADHFRKQLEARIKSFAKDISRKYINPPRTTERAILFLPTESLFAEVLRVPGLFDHVQRECHVMLAGPTTFAAILHAFQVNHRSMVIAERSGDVWKILSAVRTEFKRYNDTVGKVAPHALRLPGVLRAALPDGRGSHALGADGPAALGAGDERLAVRMSIAVGHWGNLD